MVSRPSCCSGATATVFAATTQTCTISQRDLAILPDNAGEERGSASLAVVPHELQAIYALFPFCSLFFIPPEVVEEGAWVGGGYPLMTQFTL